MRQARDQKDNNNLFRQISNFMDRFNTKNLDMGGKKIINVGPGTAANEVATVGQLPKIPEIPDESDQYYEIVWNSDAPINDDQVISSYIVGKGREGIPIGVYVCTDDTGVPTGDDGLIINVEMNGSTILETDLVLPKNTAGPVYSARFVDPIPKLPFLARIKPTITTAGASSFVTVCLAVKRTK